MVCESHVQCLIGGKNSLMIMDKFLSTDATSSNLVDWTHFSPVLSEADGVMIYSGSSVNDLNNTAGFGPTATVAAYTCHRSHEEEGQCLGYSIDGSAWHKYKGNPVIEYEPGFRDPKVFCTYL